MTKGLLPKVVSDEGRVHVVSARRLLIVPEFDAAACRILARPDAPLGRFLRAPPGADGTPLASRALLKRVFDQLTFLELSMTQAG